MKVDQWKQQQGRQKFQCGNDRRIPHQPIFNNIIPIPVNIVWRRSIGYLIVVLMNISRCVPITGLASGSVTGVPAPDAVICRWRRPRPSAGAGAGDGNPGAEAGML